MLLDVTSEAGPVGPPIFAATELAFNVTVAFRVPEDGIRNVR